ncbi:MAG TPA: rhomboid family intramembrane serine protease [Fimbriiglobus sp.]|nr:rhomboid family intramembrane serine protease [Fimbriiglobus sp.]
MGIYDRDYYRDSSGRWWADLGGRSATFWLVLVTCVVFVGQVLTAQPPGGIGRDPLAEWGDFYLPAILDGQLWRLITPHFLHGGLWHIFLNMLVLYWVGRELEGIYGSREFLAFYLTTALLISLGMVALGLAGINQGRALGASGPVTAAFILFACHFPYRTILLFFIIPCPAWLLAVGIVVLDFMGFIGRGQPGIGYSAHLLGAVFAFAYFRLHWRVTGWLDQLTGWVPRSRGRRAPTPRLFVESDDLGETVGARTGGAPATAEGRASRSVDEQLEAKLDQVLEKVSRYGRESLTPEERDILLRASEIYKRRRGQ